MARLCFCRNRNEVEFLVKNHIALLVHQIKKLHGCLDGNSVQLDLNLSYHNIVLGFGLEPVGRRLVLAALAVNLEDVNDSILVAQFLHGPADRLKLAPQTTTITACLVSWHTFITFVVGGCSGRAYPTAEKSAGTRMKSTSERNHSRFHQYSPIAPMTDILGRFLWVGTCSIVLPLRGV